MVPERAGRAAGVELGVGFGVVAAVDVELGAGVGAVAGAALQPTRTTIAASITAKGNMDHFLTFLVFDILSPVVIFRVLSSHIGLVSWLP